MASSERTNTIDSDGSNQCVEKTMNRGIENNNIDMNNCPNRSESIDNIIGDTNDGISSDDLLRIARTDMVPHQQHQHECDETSSGSTRNNNSDINNIVNNRSIAEGTNGILDESDQSHVGHLAVLPDIQSTSSPSSSGLGVVRENGNHTRDGVKPENGLVETNNKHSSGKYYVMRK